MLETLWFPLSLLTQGPLVLAETCMSPAALRQRLVCLGFSKYGTLCGTRAYKGHFVPAETSMSPAASVRGLHVLAFALKEPCMVPGKKDKHVLAETGMSPASIR